MTVSIPVSIIEGWINDFQPTPKEELQGPNADLNFWVRQGMIMGFKRIGSMLTTWCRHQKYVQTLNRLGRKFLMVRRVNISDGRFRKLEWYENDLFLTLAWRHAQGAERGELMLETQQVDALSKIYLVYEGDLSFDDLALLARKGGLDSIKNEEDWRKWD